MENTNLKMKLDESVSPPAEQKALPKDIVFDLLSSSRRRNVLTYMAEHGPKTTLPELAEHIAAKENDTEERLLSSQQRKRVYVALYQCHLPRMDDADVIDFVKNRGNVTLRPNAVQLYQYMEVRPVYANGTDTRGGQSLSDRVIAARTKIEKLLRNSA